MSVLAAHIASLLESTGRRGIKSHKNWASREYRAWAAGLFDGEGYVGVKSGGCSASNKKYLTASVSQKDRRALDIFQRVVGSGKIRGPYRTKNPVYVWSVSSLSEILRLFECLDSWLGPVKHTQFVAAITTFLHSHAEQKRGRR